MMLYTLAKALHISPMEALQMPYDMVVELLEIHMQVEQYKLDELDNISKGIKTGMR